MIFRGIKRILLHHFHRGVAWRTIVSRFNNFDSIIINHHYVNRWTLIRSCCITPIKYSADTEHRTGSGTEPIPQALTLCKHVYRRC